jgi:acyl-CoA thioesterase
MSGEAAEEQLLAERCARVMWDDDQASQGLGMVVEAVGPGTARLAMTVTAVMVNGHGTCHGGYIFTLADSAFAFACNSYNERTVAQHCSISFLRPVQLGQRLVASATERSRARRTGIYDVTVTAGDGIVVAEFRGLARAIGGSLV